MNHTDRDLLLAEACEVTTAEEHRAVSAHLEECPECLDRFAGYCAERTIIESAAQAVRPRGRGRLLLAAAALPFVLTLGAILWHSPRPTPPGSTEAGPVPKPQEATPPPTEQAFPFLGRLLPSREVLIYSKVQAYVERVEATRGARVKKGDLLVELKAPELQAIREEARVHLSQDETELRRVETMAEKAQATGQDLDQARAKVAIDKARLASCEANLSYLRIVAPFDGIITERSVEEGSLVGPPAAVSPTPLLKLENIDRLRMVVSLPASSEPTLDLVARGDRVPFAQRGRAEKRMSGTYLGSTRSVDPSTGTFTVDVEIDNSSLGLLPGMIVIVAWPPDKK